MKTTIDSLFAKVLGIGLLLSLTITSCRKTSEDLSAFKEPENIYQLNKTGFADVDQKLEDILKTYNVYIFFNDTISQVYVGKSIKGEDVYTYNTIDPKWSFSNYDRNSKFEYEYITDHDTQLQMVSFLEHFLASAPETLRPKAFFALKSLDTQMTKVEIPIKNLEDNSEKILQIINAFQAVVIEADALENISTDEQELEVVQQMVRDQLKIGILKFTRELNDFMNYTDRNLYGKKFKDIVPNYDPTLGQVSLFLDYQKYKDAWYYSDEEKDARNAKAIPIVGNLGFICGDRFGIATPDNVMDDLKMYITEIIRMGSEGFTERWGAYPLVMDKYNIVYKVIQDKFGITL